MRTSINKSTAENMPSYFLGLPSSLWFLSIGAFFLNLSSVIAFAVTPIFMRKIFGTTDLQTGILEGTVEGFSLIVRSLTGVFSDFIGRRKIFLMWGYGVSVFARFLLAPATLINEVIAARILEKVGNGLQASPREAFISDISPSAILGRAYSLNKVWSMSGSLAGGCVLMLVALKNPYFNVRNLLWFCGWCALLSTTILFFLVKDPKIKSIKTRSASLKDEWRNIFSEISQFPKTFWATIGIICLFKLGLFSGTFLMARLRDSGAFFMGQSLKSNELLSNGVFQLFQCTSCTLFAYPLGLLFDRIDRRIVVAIGFFFMVAALVIFSQGNSANYMYSGIIFYGLQYSLHGSLMAWLSTTMPHHLHGTGFSIFFFTSGISVIFTNTVLLRKLSLMYGIETAFGVIAGIVFLAICFIPLIPKTPKAIKKD
jgi:MFS family permease